MSKQPIIVTKRVSKTFQTGNKLLVAVNEVDLEVYSGDFVLILGPSGCGKSTLLHMLLGLENPTYGKVFLRGEDIYALEDDERADMRK